MAGPQGQGPVIAGERRFILLQIAQRIAQIIVGLGEIGLHAQGRLTAVRRVLVSPQLAQHIAAIAQRLGKVSPERDRLVIAGQRGSNCPRSCSALPRLLSASAWSDCTARARS